MIKKSDSPLSSISQQDAADLIGRSSRWLRDSTAPRNEDGAYNAKLLVAWYVNQVSDSESDDLKAAKLREEINVLQERNRKLQFANETTAGNMANVVNLRDMLFGIVPPMKQLGELLGRKTKVSGRDAQQMINQALDDYVRLLSERLPSND